MLREGAHIEGVESIAGALNAPYDFSTSIGGMTLNGRSVSVEFTEATDGFHDVLHLDVIRGRWFEPGDNVLTYRPIVVNTAFVREAFPGEDPIGKLLPRDPTEAESRIVGVVSDYRKGGELSLPGPFIIHRIPLGRGDVRPPQTLVVRARPGVDAGFEERLVRALQEITPDWSLEAHSLASSRQISTRASVSSLASARLARPRTFGDRHPGGRSGSGCPASPST